MRKILGFLLVLACMATLVSCRYHESHGETTIAFLTDGALANESLTEEIPAVDAMQKDLSQEIVPVTIEVEKLTDVEIEIRIYNHSPKPVTYGESFYLEQYEDGAWVLIEPLAEHFGFHDIAYEVKPDEETLWSAKYSSLYGTLLNGEYRISKNFLIDGAGPLSIAGGFSISGHEPVDTEIEDCIRKKVESFEEECTLINVWFDSEKSEAEIDSYLKNGRGDKKEVKRENVCVLFSNLKTGQNTWSFESNTIYSDWKWILIRDHEDAEWIVADYGG